MSEFITHTEIILGGEVFHLKPSFAAIAEIERQTGKGFFTLAKSLQSGEFTFSDLIEIIYIGVKHGGNKAVPNKNKIADIMVEQGVESAIKPVVQYFKVALGGNGQ